MRQFASNWTLARDRDLLDDLERRSNSFISNIERARTALDGLSNETRATAVQVENVIGDFNNLANTQFIENRVAEELQPAHHINNLGSSTNNASDGSGGDTAQLRQRVEQSITLGLSAFGLLPASQLEDTTLTQEQAYRDRVLPYIIGSSEWVGSEHAGLPDLQTPKTEGTVILTDDLLQDEYVAQPVPRKDYDSISIVTEAAFEASEEYFEQFNQPEASNAKKEPKQERSGSVFNGMKKVLQDVVDRKKISLFDNDTDSEDNISSGTPSSRVSVTEDAALNSVVANRDSPSQASFVSEENDDQPEDIARNLANVFAGNNNMVKKGTLFDNSSSSDDDLFVVKSRSGTIVSDKMSNEKKKDLFKDSLSGEDDLFGTKPKESRKVVLESKPSVSKSVKETKEKKVEKTQKEKANDLKAELNAKLSKPSTSAKKVDKDTSETLPRKKSLFDDSMSGEEDLFGTKTTKSTKTDVKIKSKAADKVEKSQGDKAKDIRAELNAKLSKPPVSAKSKKDSNQKTTEKKSLDKPALSKTEPKESKETLKSQKKGLFSDDSSEDDLFGSKLPPAKPQPERKTSQPKKQVSDDAMEKAQSSDVVSTVSETKTEEIEDKKEQNDAKKEANDAKTETGTEKEEGDTNIKIEQTGAKNVETKDTGAKGRLEKMGGVSMLPTGLLAGLKARQEQMGITVPSRTRKSSSSSVASNSSDKDSPKGEEVPMTRSSPRLSLSDVQKGSGDSTSSPTSQLLTSVTKGRAKLPTGRRLPTRGRIAGLPPSFSSGPSGVNKQLDQDKWNISENTPSTSSDNEVSSKIVDTKPPDNAQTTETATEVKSSLFSESTSDDEIFVTEKTDKEKPMLRISESEDDIVEPLQKIESKLVKDPIKKKSIFSDTSDDDLFASKPNPNKTRPITQTKTAEPDQKSKKNSIFADDSDEDIFASKPKSKGLTSKQPDEAPAKKEVVKNPLFSDDDESDLFATSVTAKKDIVTQKADQSKVKSETKSKNLFSSGTSDSDDLFGAKKKMSQKSTTVAKKVENPLFGDDEDEEDIFASKSSSKSSSRKSSLKGGAIVPKTKSIFADDSSDEDLFKKK